MASSLKLCQLKPLVTLTWNTSSSLIMCHILDRRGGGGFYPLVGEIGFPQSLVKELMIYVVMGFVLFKKITIQAFEKTDDYGLSDM